MLGIIAASLAAYLLGIFAQIIFWRNALTRVAVGIGMCLFGWLAARIHLFVFDKMFLERGSLDYFQSLKPKNQLPIPDSDLRLK